MPIEARGDLSISDCRLGLTMVGLVVVEIWGEVSRLREIWWRSCTASPTYNQNSVEG
jgi:hypothetical protein